MTSKHMLRARESPARVFWLVSRIQAAVLRRCHSIAVRFLKRRELQVSGYEKHSGDTSPVFPHRSRERAEVLRLS